MWRIPVIDDVLPFVMLGPVGDSLGLVIPGPWAHSCVGRCWARAMLESFEGIYLLGPVGPRALLGSFIWAMLASKYSNKYIYIYIYIFYITYMAKERER